MCVSLTTKLQRLPMTILQHLQVSILQHDPLNCIWACGRNAELSLGAFTVKLNLISTSCDNDFPQAFLRVCWHQHVTTSEVLSHAGVCSLAQQIARWCTAVFGNIARLADNVSAHLAIHCQINTSVDHLLSNNWKHRPGRPNNRWLDLVQQDSNCSPVDLWRKAVHRGHGARTTLWPLLATQSWWWYDSWVIVVTKIATDKHTDEQTIQ